MANISNNAERESLTNTRTGNVKQKVLYFWQYWGLNLGLHTCTANTLQLEPFLQSILLWLFSR
jgi:hypothetical protein